MWQTFHSHCIAFKVFNWIKIILIDLHRWEKKKCPSILLFLAMLIQVNQRWVAIWSTNAVVSIDARWKNTKEKLLQSVSFSLCLTIKYHLSIYRRVEVHSNMPGFWINCKLHVIVVLLSIFQLNNLKHQNIVLKLLTFRAFVIPFNTWSVVCYRYAIQTCAYEYWLRYTNGKENCYFPPH